MIYDLFAEIVKTEKMSGDAESLINEDLPTIAEDLVVTKYTMAAGIVNKVLKEMVEECKVGCSIRDLCIMGDKKLTEETGKAYKKDKKIVKGKNLEYTYNLRMMTIFVVIRDHTNGLIFTE